MDKIDRKYLADCDKVRIKDGQLAEVVAGDIYDLLSYAVDNNIWKDTWYDLVGLSHIKDWETDGNVVRIKTWRKNLEIVVREI